MQPIRDTSLVISRLKRRISRHIIASGRVPVLGPTLEVVDVPVVTSNPDRGANSVVRASPSRRHSLDAEIVT